MKRFWRADGLVGQLRLELVFNAVVRSQAKCQCVPSQRDIVMLDGIVEKSLDDEMADPIRPVVDGNGVLQEEHCRLSFWEKIDGIAEANKHAVAAKGKARVLRRADDGHPGHRNLVSRSIAQHTR